MQTAGPGAPPAPPRSVRTSTASRLKATEPVRLYLWPLVVVLVLVAVATGLVTQQWAEWALPCLGLALGIYGAGEAARASAYSLAGHLDRLAKARDRWESITRGGGQ